MTFCNYRAMSVIRTNCESYPCNYSTDHFRPLTLESRSRLHLSRLHSVHFLLTWRLGDYRKCWYDDNCWLLRPWQGQISSQNRGLVVIYCGSLSHPHADLFIVAILSAMPEPFLSSDVIISLWKAAQKPLQSIVGSLRNYSISLNWIFLQFVYNTNSSFSITCNLTSLMVSSFRQIYCQVNKKPEFVDLNSSVLHDNDGLIQ